MSKIVPIFTLKEDSETMNFAALFATYIYISASLLNAIYKA
jgi:hypothetical protein